MMVRLGTSRSFAVSCCRLVCVYHCGEFFCCIFFLDVVAKQGVGWFNLDVSNGR